jgi:hypothetical protein
MSWYPHPGDDYHAGTPRVWFLRAATAGKVAEGYLRPDDRVFRIASARGLAVVNEPLERLPEIEQLVKRRMEREALATPRSR